MYVEYLFTLVVFSIAFRLLNVLVAAAAAVIWLPLERLSAKAGAVFEFLLQLFFCTTFGGMISAVTVMYAQDQSVEHTWLYFWTGFAVAFIALFGNAGGKDRRSSGTTNGAAWGAFLGLGLFAIIYNWPFTASWLPGLLPCFDSLDRVSNWLISLLSFRVIRWGVALYIAYLLLGWASTLFAVGMFGVGWLAIFMQKVFRREHV